MTKLRVNCFSLSLDGYGAGPNQSLAEPMGEGGMALHQWVFPTRTFCRMLGKEGGSEAVDESFAAKGFENLGAWILGRNMFAWSRGPWPEEDEWRGWWGDTPPYHTPVFVLTNYPSEAHRQTAARLGARGFFDKSHEVDRLRDEIGKLLR